MPPMVPLEADDDGELVEPDGELVEPMEPLLVVPPLEVDVSADPAPPVVEPCACEVPYGLEAVPCAVLSVVAVVEPVVAEPVVVPDVPVEP